MKALSRDSTRLNKNKENENPLNNNTTPFNLKHSTPIKYRKITDSDYPERISPVDINATDSENFLEKKKMVVMMVIMVLLVMVIVMILVLMMMVVLEMVVLAMVVLKVIVLAIVN